MGKKGKKRRLESSHLNPQAARGYGFKASAAHMALARTAADDSDDSDGSELLPESFLDAAALLHSIVAEPALYHTAPAKPLRAALHALLASGVMSGNGSTPGTSGNVSGCASHCSSSGSSGLALPSSHEKIAVALLNRDWDIAVAELSAMRSVQKRPPKIGTLQRWVNMCDSVFSLGNTKSGPQAGPTGSGGEGGTLPRGLIRALDAVLRTADPLSVGYITKALAKAGAASAGGGAPPSSLPYTDLAGGAVRDYPAWKSSTFRPVTTGTDSGGTSLLVHDARVLKKVAAADRVPVNVHDLKIWSGEGLTLASASASASAAVPALHVGVERVDVTRDAMFLSNVLSAAESATIIALGEEGGFDADEPMFKEQESILAHAFVWVTGQHFIDSLWARVKVHLPSGAVGLNRRFRCYRYRSGAVYRPHIDGAWPPSWAPEADQPGDYKYDSSDGKVLSKFTFLIYLNQDFEGGGTTFYNPALEDGTLDRRAITPQTGCALVFPHGATGHAALHEGSEVTTGTKYVVRTEVLFPL